VSLLRAEGSVAVEFCAEVVSGRNHIVQRNAADLHLRGAVIDQGDGLFRRLLDRALLDVAEGNAGWGRATYKKP